MPNVLILSNKFDFASDYIAAELNKRGVSYLRLNHEDLPAMEISLFPIEPRLVVKFGNLEFEIKDSTLKSIFFRRPVFLRDNYNPKMTPSEQLSRSQWSAFNRGLLIFTKCIWVNHPKSTYAAESKPFQLHIAHSVNFRIPNTFIANTDNKISEYFRTENIAIKCLDSALLKISGKDAFVYTNAIKQSEVNRENLAIAPVVFQEFLSNKIDIRVTVVKDSIFSVCIKHGDKGVSGDWRLMKDKVEYIPTELPKSIRNKCLKLVKKLGLYYGAIDLAKQGDDYYFLEINPTGEWAWLVNSANLPIDSAIADLLCEYV